VQKSHEPAFLRWSDHVASARSLGQQNMAFCNDLEDINSVCMTAIAVTSLPRSFCDMQKSERNSRFLRYGLPEIRCRAEPARKVQRCADGHRQAGGRHGDSHRQVQIRQEYAVGACFHFAGTCAAIYSNSSSHFGRVRLLNEHGNFDVEGVDNINACYGGTAALLNTMAWVRFLAKARENFTLGSTAPYIHQHAKYCDPP
jgi:hypothetical protein